MLIVLSSHLLSSYHLISYRLISYRLIILSLIVLSSYRLLTCFRVLPIGGHPLSHVGVAPHQIAHEILGEEEGEDRHMSRGGCDMM